MTTAGIWLVLLSVALFPSEWFQFLTGVLADAEFVFVFPFGLAALVTVALFGVEWTLQGFGRNERSL
jgi:hypothetical protein